MKRSTAEGARSRPPRPRPRRTPGDVESDTPAHALLLSNKWLTWENRRANDTYGSALAAHPGESQGRPSTNSGSQPTQRRTACPACVCSRMPPSRTVAPYSRPGRSRRRSDHGHGQHLRPFILDTNIGPSPAITTPKRSRSRRRFAPERTRERPRARASRSPTPRVATRGPEDAGGLPPRFATSGRTKRGAFAGLGSRRGRARAASHKRRGSRAQCDPTKTGRHARARAR